MNIVNQIDPENPKNNRTIDLDSGIFMQIADRHAREHFIGFRLTNEDFDLFINTFVDLNVNQEKKIEYILYNVDKIEYYDPPKKYEYFNLIEDFLQVHGFLFRIGEEKFGTLQVVEVRFEERALEVLESLNV